MLHCSLSDPLRLLCLCPVKAQPHLELAVAQRLLQQAELGGAALASKVTHAEVRGPSLFLTVGDEPHGAHAGCLAIPVALGEDLEAASSPVTEVEQGRLQRISAAQGLQAILRQIHPPADILFVLGHDHIMNIRGLAPRGAATLKVGAQPGFLAGSGTGTGSAASPAAHGVGARKASCCNMPARARRASQSKVCNAALARQGPPALGDHSLPHLPWSPEAASSVASAVAGYGAQAPIYEGPRSRSMLYSACWGPKT
mmetsp:Transcript_65279/g.142146  ORF Transcript_65279/g.142146 Transcript_65279/m.142146 type:complete len:256 (-) Transcript_65279:7-774(-)